MRRVQINLNEDTWETLRVKARQRQTTISDLVRSALQEKYLLGGFKQKEAMMAAGGLWKGRKDLPDTQAYIRRLRKDRRLERLFR
jgi:Ribbon-helix-helix protein, copG family